MTSRPKLANEVAQYNCPLSLAIRPAPVPWFQDDKHLLLWLKDLRRHGGDGRTMGDGVWFGGAMFMAVSAADPVNVVGAFGAGEGGVHLLNVDAAVGHLRVTGFA